MKVGLGLYRHMLTREYYDFARQAGCTHVVVHLVDYFNKGATNPRNNQPTGAKYEPWGVAGDPQKLWAVDELKKLRQGIEEAGLVLAAIENLDPAHWHDILLNGPQRSQQVQKAKTIIRCMGEARVSREAIVQGLKKSSLKKSNYFAIRQDSVYCEWQHAERSYPGRELRSTQTRTPSSLDEREPRLHGLRDRVGECLWPCAGIQDLPGQLSTITFFLHRLAARLVWCRNPGRSQAGA
jgi:hypothetical protein